MDDGLGEAGGVVLDADGPGGFVEVELADSVDLAELGDGEGGSLGWQDAITVKDVKLGHGVMIAAAMVERRQTQVLYGKDNQIARMER